MPNDLTRVYVPFADVIKTTVKGADGAEQPARIVRGIMTEEKLDLDEQIVDYDWAKGASAKWWNYANIREQHTSKGVGKGREIEYDDANRRITLTSKIVDGDAIMKIDEGVYSGYSIGIKGAGIVKDAAAPNGRINRGNQVECSIVDHPSLETAKFAVVKMRKDGKPELGAGIEPLTDDDAELFKVAGADETKLADVSAEKSTTVVQTTPGGTTTVWVDDQQVSPAGADGDADDNNPLAGTDAEPEAARVTSAVDADLGGSLTPVEPTGDKTTTPQITKSEEDIEVMYAKAFPELKDLLIKGDTAAALALIQATEVLTKSTAPAPVVTSAVETVAEPAAVQPPATTTADKSASPDTLKAAISEAVNKAVETAFKPLMEKVVAMEKRAAPGGPLLSGTRLLSAPEDVKGQFLKGRIEDIKKMADEHPDGSMRQGARELLAELEKHA